MCLQRGADFFAYGPGRPANATDAIPQPPSSKLPYGNPEWF